VRWLLAISKLPLFAREMNIASLLCSFIRVAHISEVEWQTSGIIRTQ